MRTGGVCTAALLFLATLVIQVSTVEDIYWEGENGEDSEFLEVKEESPLSHLTRLKRNFDWWGGSLFSTAPSTTTLAPENYESVTGDEEDTADSNDYDGHADGSGAVPERIEPDPSEKTLRVSFVVMEPFLDDYSNRDSELFKAFSYNLANAVNALFDGEPGTQKASLVRIQSRPSDNFSCKVTLDIVTTADNTDRIAELLHTHIRNTRTLGNYTLTDTDYSANVVNPGSPFEKCQPGELQCKDGHCVPGASICDGVNDCSDGADEHDNCPRYDPEQRRDDSINQVETPRPRCSDPIYCSSSAVTICPEQQCNGFEDCPGGEDEDPNMCSPPTPERGDQSFTTPAHVEDTTKITIPVSERACPAGEFSCDEGRCIFYSQVCDREPDCTDGTDEANCKEESCGRDDFKCGNNKCIEGFKRCDRVFDCPDREDEFDCECTSDDFRCNDDGSCIEKRKRCDGTANCRDGSDEIDCACKPDQWQCDQGNCIQRSKRCNGRIDCPSDRSDERNCVAHGYFKCQTGKVIPDSMRCNRRYDCQPGDYSDEQNCPCGDDDFRCNNGHCIQAYKRCDRTHDCQDGSDELHCKYGKDCMAYEYKCTSGECVHAEAICNGTVECTDGSDESKCPCKRGQFRCRDGSCINIALRCDGHKDCRQGEDELNCGPCSEDAYTCPRGSRVQCATPCNGLRECDNGDDEEECENIEDDECPHTCDGKCLDANLICNGLPDCSDGSDETACNSCDRPEDFRCDDDNCISQNERCNGVPECPDGSDELNCNATITATRDDCPDRMFTCRDGSCVNPDFHCDGNIDCIDGSDEIGCPCQVGSFHCDGDRCLSTSVRCNGNIDCYDGTDESPEYCAIRPSTEYTYTNPSTPSPIFPTTRETYVSGSAQTVPVYSPYAPRTDRPQTSDDDDDRDARDRNDLENSITTRAPADGRFNTYGTDRPESNDPYGYNQPGSNYPYDSNQAGSNYPYDSNQVGSNDPNSPNQAGSNYPYDSNQAGSNNPFDSNQAGSNYPYDSNQAGSNDPNSPNQAGSNYPYDSNQAGSNDPNSPNQAGSNYPYDSNQVGSNDSNGSNQAGSYDPYGSNQAGSNNPYGSNRDGLNDPYGSNQAGSNNPYDSNQAGSNNRYDSNQAGSNNPYDSNQAGSNDPYGSDRDGYGSNEPGSMDPYQGPDNQPGAYPSGSTSGQSQPNRPVSGGGTSVDCNSFEWSCEKGSCIDASRRCDGHIDCPNDYSDEFDCPAGSPPALNVKIYPKDGQSQRFGGDVVFQCREEGPLRARVRWYREGGRPLKANSTDVRGRLELFQVTMSDSGVYICQAQDYSGQPGSEVRVHLTVKTPRPIITRPTFVPCNANEATCTNGECILRSAICDGNVDCSDRSDEDMCPYSGKCEPNQFQCENRKCVLKSWLCDSDDDCGDGSDEKSCPSEDSNSLCLPMEFACHSNDQCIPKSFHCDGSKDCVDNSDEVGCSQIYITKTPTPANVKLSPGDTLVLTCEAVGVPTPIISWRLNWGHVPSKCTWTNDKGVGVLTCPNIMPEDSGAYSCEAINPAGTSFAQPDSIVFVNRTNPCPDGYFNNEARSQNECIRCFCFGKSTRCHSADLFTYNMPTPLGEGGTRLLGVALSDDGAVRTDPSIINHYYYQSLRNGATVTKLESHDEARLGSFHPFLTLPESYNGNQLTSYGGHIKYTIYAHNNYPIQDGIPSIIVKGKYATLFHIPRNDMTSLQTNIEARFVPEYWEKSGPNGDLIPATREDIMMALDAIDMILLRADNNNAGVNITEFVMESAQHINSNLGAASLVEECTCPEGYDGISCQKCKPGWVRENSGPWLGPCVRKQCPPGTYGDPSMGNACRPCPCPLTNRGNQFATTCSLGYDGSVTCDCFTGYEGKTCEKCAPGYEGNPLIAGDSCRVRPTHNCNQIGTRHEQLLDECVCKDHVVGRYCDQCKNDSFYLSNDFRHGCALCFCSGESQQCMSSNLRRKTTAINFNVPSIVEQVKVYNIQPQGNGNFRYTAPVETNLRPYMNRGVLGLSGLDRSLPTVYYWSMPLSFTGNKVTSYGGYLRYTLDNVRSYVDERLSNTAADIQLISDNHLTFQYFGNFQPSIEGVLNVSVQLLEKGWQRSDGKEVPREHFLLALADVKTILIKATYSNDAIATPLFASIDTASSDGDGPAALHVEQCICPPGHIGTSCEDCAPGYTRGYGGLYLAHCEACQCNDHSRNCHPETGQCYECLDNTDGPHCELCKPGYERDGYDKCTAIEGSTTIVPCGCDPRGESEPCEADGSCTCKRNVNGEYCDRCRPGTFGLDAANPDGCISCFCSGATTECQEANHYYRVAIPAPIFGDNYGGYTIMDINAETVINEQFIPEPDRSELQYVFSNPADRDLYWSLPVFPGNRVLSYGGSISLRQEFQANSYNLVSEQGNDVILIGDDISVAWYNPNTLRSGESLTYQVPLREEGWTILNSAQPADRSNFMHVLSNLRRVLVKATLARDILSTSIADVSMDTATEQYQLNAQIAKGIEMCTCPPGHLGTSCETCAAGYYKNEQNYCQPCPCKGHDCQLDTNMQVVCNCRPPYTGRDCSTIGLLMELHPTLRDDYNPVLKHVTLTCKYRAAEPLAIKFVVEGQDQGPLKSANESILHADGWHGEHVMETLWDTRIDGKIYECYTITRKGAILGVLYTDMRPSAFEGNGHSQVTTNPPPMPDSTITVRITSPTITIQEVGSSVNFTCQAQSPFSRRLILRWSKVDGYLPQDRTFIDEYSGMLRINNLQVTDSGQYICQTSDGRSTGQASVTLKVPATEMDFPSVEIRPPVNDYYVGDRIELECVATGSPQPSISWQRASRRPLPRSYEQYGNVLVIESAMEEYSGEYRCIASNTAGSADRTAVITVRPRPAQPPRDRLVVQPTSATVNEGQSTRIVCTGSTNVPAGTIDWVRQDGDRFEANVRSDNGVLYIDVATMENAGVYVCQTHGADVTPEAMLLTVLTTAIPSPGQEPRVTIPKTSLKIPSGESTEIDCFPSGDPLPLIRWSKHEGEFGLGVSQRDNTLIINNAEESDAGYYACQGLDRRDRHVLTHVYIYVDIEKRDKPEVAVWPKGEQPVTLGDTQFEFQCRVLSGSPKPEVTWSRSGGRALSPHVEIKPNNILKFDKIEVNDEGEYICTADNLAGSSSAIGVIKVRSLPEIVITPHNYLEINEGAPVNVECRADGYPEPWVTIKGPDGREISSNTRIASLRLSSVRTQDDGDYTCSASNSAGKMDDTFVIRVETRGDLGGDYDGSGDIEITPNPPVRPTQNPYPYPYPNPRPTENPYPRPVEQNVFEGTELNIYCNVTNGFNPRWDRGDRQPLQINARQIENRLIIHNATRSDSGIYVCTVYNEETGQAQVALSTNIRVVGTPKITLRPPMQTVRPGNMATVECVVEGEEILDIIWRPTDKPFSSRVEVRGGTLIFHQIEVEDAGLYECVARNQWANTSATAKVIVEEESDVASSESHSHEQWVRSGAGVMLSCNVSSAAGTTVTWTKDGETVPESIRTNPDGSLFIKIAHTSHTGLYVCLIRDMWGRQTSNYINLHIEGDNCTDTEFRCADNEKCIEKKYYCNGIPDCADESDEGIKCFMTRKKRIKLLAGGPERPLAEIEQPRRAFRAGENVEVLCKTVSRDIAVEWIKRDEHGNRQHVDYNNYGDGSMLVIKGVTADDAGVYLCISRNRLGQNYTDNFDLQIVPGSEISNPRERNVPVREYTAALRTAVDMPCNHDLEEPVNIQWRREYTALPNDARTNQPILHIRSVTEGDAGTYVCHVSNYRTNAMAKAILRVVGVVPRFDGDSWVALPALRDAYRQFNIEVSFKPTDSNGLILYNSQNAGRVTDYLALQLIEGVPEFSIETGSGAVSVRGDRPLTLNQWHTIRLNKIASKVSMDVDSDGLFEADTPDNGLLELRQPLYIGGIPDYNQLPAELVGARGFAGCVSMLLLGQEEKNIILDQLDQYRVSTCDTCAGNLCHNGSVCQEARTERGYVCLCNKDFAGPNCDRRGEACRPGLCGTGKCTTTNDGYKCACPVTHTGKNCETRQQIEYPAFTGSAYVALKPPNTARFLKMSMKVKATAPVSDGIIMYCAESPRGYGGFTSLAVRNGRLEYRYDLGEGSPVILVSNTTLAANDWTDVQVTRSGTTVSLNINMVHNYEKSLNSAKSLKLETPMFVGGVDENIILNSNTGVTSGFMGCIKDLKTSGDIVDIVNDPNVESSNVQECTNIPNRGDIPETDLSTCPCKNRGICVADYCECLPGFTGTYCETRQASPLRYPTRPPTDPCEARPCRNGGTCRTDYSNMMNTSCDCPLGFSGASCQMRLDLYQSVGFNGNGYLELPARLVNYEDLDREPAIIALRAYTVQDGVLAYQREALAPPGNGDYLLIRIEHGYVVVEWDMGSGIATLSVNSADNRAGFVTDGEMHRIVLKLLPDGRLELSVDGITEQGLTNGLTNRLNADSNIYIGGMPERLNVNGYPGLRGCIDQVEFMDLGRGVNLGNTAVTGRNTQPCKN